MSEEKSMIEYKEQKGLLNWLKSKFEKLKEKFRPKVNEKQSDINWEDSLSPEELENAMSGFDLRTNIGQNPNAVRDYVKLSDEDKKRIDENYAKMIFPNNDTKDQPVVADEEKEIE